jgi:hypothetical protein
VKRLDRFGKTRLAPIEHVVVRQRAAVGSRRGEAADVRRMHAVVDALVHPVIAARDRGLQVDDSGVRFRAREFGERIAPDIRIVDPARNGAARALREAHVVDRVVEIAFVDARIARMAQDLVDPAPGHHVAAKEELDGLMAHGYSHAGTVPAGPSQC